MKAVILANGEYPTHALPLRMFQEAEMVVCCDGAANEYIRRGGTPTAIVGDGDSIAPAYRHLLHQVSEQETNDLTKAVRFLREKGIEEVAVLGATGRREDHTIGNVSLLMEYYKKGINVLMFTDFGFFRPCQSRTVFSAKKGQQISVFNFGCTRMQSEGLKYPLYNLQNWWQGTLNEALDDSFTIEADGYYLVYFVYEP